MPTRDIAELRHQHMPLRLPHDRPPILDLRHDGIDCDVREMQLHNKTGDVSQIRVPAHLTDPFIVTAA